MTPQEQEACIQERRFDDLFIGQGWDEAHDQPFYLELRDGEIFQIQAKFQKRGFAVCFCDDERVLRLSTAERKRLLHRLGKRYYEHLLIAHGENEQHWLVSIRPQDQPLRVAMVQWQKGQDVQKLREKLAGLIFPMAEEETLSISKVVERVRTAFSVNAEKISKGFYGKFQTELNHFEKFIKGINDIAKREEYAALMLNRLMFIYFMQKKGFLNNEKDYLKKRLQQTKERLGKDEFYGFYREFLRCLFHQGLDTPAGERSDEINELLGKVPYLNGGLFDPSQLEIENDEIAISDALFERLFNFFDKYNWHLDDRLAASGRDINPEVLGYIFEKYINDRAQMGAYYTQEDITDYIAKNTLLPFLLRRAREGCKNAFEYGGVWRLLRDKPDDYIYDAVKHGCEFLDDEIPEDIRQGIDTAKPDLLERRSNWNKPAPEKFALPTETWREVIARRERYFELHGKLKAGEIREIDDLITYNLDIVQFVGDTLLDYEGADYIAAVFRAIAGVRQNWVKGTNEKTRRGISVLDPSCGSGAFLFAALNILEPLYDACIGRMKKFVKQDDGKAKAEKGNKYPFFRKVLEEIGKHQNQRYWIYKTIILENLYGVDIMAEAAEIAKLRLFLKLAAEAEYNKDKPNLGLEPLPDIDYNIRSGNSLVGFASMKEFESVATAGLDLSSGLLEKVREQAIITQQANDRFRQAQDRNDGSYVDAKRELAKRLAELNEKLNQYLAEDYGQGKDESNRYEQWKATHQPFHWLADFYGIIEGNGGFDVVIGNPPYVEYTKVKDTYTIKNYETESCGNLYALFMERNIFISNSHSNIGQIVPVSIIATPQYSQLREIYYEQGCNHITSYNIHPCCLFEGAYPRLSILLLDKKSEKKLCMSKYYKWNTKERKELFNLIQYFDIPKKLMNKKIKNFMPKLENINACNIINKIENEKKTIFDFTSNLKHEKDKNSIFYRRAFGAFVLFYDFLPEMFDEYGSPMLPTELKSIQFNSAYSRLALAIYYSNIFYFYTYTFSDCRNINKKNVESLNINMSEFSNSDKNKISNLSQLISNKLMSDSKMTTYFYKTGKRSFRAFYPRKCKSLIDNVDKILAKHYGFTDEELDYIINYDIKYRMGGGNE